MNGNRYIKPSIVHLLGVLFFICTALSARADEPRRWQLRTSMPTPRTGVVAVVLADRVYVMGGQDANGNALRVVERYDPGSDTWETAPGMEKARFNAAAVVLNGKIYVMGGRGSGNETLNAVEIFDPASMQWQQIDNLREGREGLNAVVLENTIYALGGSNENEQILNTVEYYDETEERWEDFLPWNLQVGRASFATVPLADSAFSMGGFSAFGPLGVVQRFYPGLGVSEKAPFSPARGGLSAAVLDDAIYVIGGRKSDNGVVGIVNRFLPSENRWEIAESLNVPRENASAVTIDGQIFIFGGNNGQGVVLGSIEAYDTVVAPLAGNDSATTLEDEPVTIDVLANDIDPAGGILLITGFTQPVSGTVTQTSASLLLYQPEKDFFGDDIFSYTVENSAGGSALATVQISVSPVNDPPAFISNPPAGTGVDTPYVYEIEAEDPDQDPLGITSSSLPAWLQLEDGGDGTALLSGTPGEADQGLFEIELFASDGTLTATQAFQLSVVDGPPPAPLLLAPSNGAAIETSKLSFSWFGSQDATYRFQLATADDFALLLVDTTLITTTIDLEDLTGETYFWRVQASNVAGGSDWSDIFSFNYTVAVGTEDELPARGFTLEPAYPDPFFTETWVPFSIEESGRQVELAIFDLNGRKLITLVSGSMPAGPRRIAWNGRDADGRVMASGVYLVRLRVDSEQETRLVTIIR